MTFPFGSDFADATVHDHARARHERRSAAQLHAVLPTIVLMFRRNEQLNPEVNHEIQ
jgi:hypothetical protein